MIDRYFNPLKLIDKKKSFFLFGARGTGKTAIVKKHLPPNGSLLYDFLKSEVYRRYVGAPELLRQEIERALETSSLTVAIDEVQRIPDILNEVHSLIEEYKGKINFILTGSSARKLKRGGANLLAGRALTTNLYPLSVLDINLNLEKSLQYGTLPGIYLENDMPVETIDAYIGTYLREEIKEEGLVRRIDRFTRFLDLAGQLNGEPINFSKLARSLDLTANTVQDYFSILVDTWICYRVDGWSESVKRQLMQAPKFYFFDCGVLNSLVGEIRSELKPSSFRFGRLFETFLIQQIICYGDYQSLGLRYSYWRDQDGHEVDLIIYRSSHKPLAAIEIKSHSKPLEEDLTGLSYFGCDYPKVPQYCFCTTPKAYKIGNIDVLPWQDGLSVLKNL